MQQLQTKELSANDYDLLLQLDEHRNKWSKKDISKWTFCDNSNPDEEQAMAELSDLNRNFINFVLFYLMSSAMQSLSSQIFA